MTGLWLGKTNESNGWYHTTLIASADCIQKLHILRYRQFRRQIDSNKITYHTFKPQSLIYNKFIAILLSGYKILKKHEIDFIITFNVFPYGLISWLLSVSHNKPLILCFVGSDYNYYLKRQPYRFFIIMACKKASMIICNGSHMIEGLKEIGIENKKMILHPNFVSNEWYGNTLETQDILYDIITICELIELKNVDVIIRAIKLLADKGINVHACIVGDGKERERLIRLTEILGIQGYIHLVGFQNNVLSFLKKSKIFVQASRSEGLSLALIEALAAGVVPITTKAGSEKDIIKDGHNGLFVKIGSHEDLANKIETLLDVGIYKKFKDVVDNERHQFSLSNASQKIGLMLKDINDE